MTDATGPVRGDVPRVLADAAALAAGVGREGERGAVWRLTEHERHLDANVIALPPGERIERHEGPAEDVLWHVLAGSGTLETDGEPVELRAGAIVWLPRGSRRQVTAGAGGLRYLSVHRRKGGLQVGRPAER
ncbi:cupin domain-containing protein [Agrococcus sp. HG114]|uniref:cupin domain-containing protein n=1 Tax=Agrococcus sp. HG114 TaxID=2969757 RepID=UPI00215B402B|nr:cupin domain-containing protein [Agrococcus sp. HG114]MCR8671968.1 cupin domain-containing protein [Agrococcus sp. HG114]